MIQKTTLRITVEVEEEVEEVVGGVKVVMDKEVSVKNRIIPISNSLMTVRPVDMMMKGVSMAVKQTLVMITEAEEEEGKLVTEGVETEVGEVKMERIQRKGKLGCQNLKKVERSKMRKKEFMKLKIDRKSVV